jgi:hypothetical protein
MAGRTGFEPVTSSVSGKADIQVRALQTYLACGYIVQNAPGCPSEIHPPDARLTHALGRVTAHGQAGTIERCVCSALAVPGWSVTLSLAPPSAEDGRPLRSTGASPALIWLASARSAVQAITTRVVRSAPEAGPGHARTRHPDVLVAQRRERARIRSERQQRWGRSKPRAA